MYCSFRFTALTLLLALAVPGGAGEQAPDTETEVELELPPREAIEAHKTYDRGPELQQTAGGGLIVNAFIMDGPVRVEIRDRTSDELVLERQEQSLFPFELSRRELGIEPTQVVVRIFVQGKLAHELDLLPPR